MWAISSNGIGELVGFRQIRDDWPLADGEIFTTRADPKGKVLASDGLSLREESPADRLPAIKRRKRRELNESRDAAMLAPVTFSGSPYDVSPDIRNDLTSAVAFLHIASAYPAGSPDVPTTVSWRDADNVDHDLTEAELLGLAAAMFAQVQSAHITARALKDQVNAATSAAQVRNIDWP